MANEMRRQNAASNVSFIEAAAKRAHDTVAFMCATGSPSWNGIPECQRIKCRESVLWILEHPNATPAEFHHEWVSGKVATGWKYGEKKSESEKTHPCLVAFSDLSKNDKMKNSLFVDSVTEMAKNYAR